MSHSCDAPSQNLETRRTEPIFNGRQGVYDDETSQFVAPSLETCGFEVHELPQVSGVTDWNSKQQLREYYVPVLKDYLRQTYGPNNIRHLLFYNPMLRGEDMDVEFADLAKHELPTSPTQPRAHLDNDWIASDLNRVVGLAEKQTLEYFDAGADFPRQELEHDIRDGYRYMVINCWRNIREQPIRRAPLAVYATRYSQEDADVDQKRSLFPAVQPDFDTSRWYIFPEMTHQECLLFKQYDRDDRYSSDVWHCALQLRKSNPQKEDHTLPSRKSFDIRAFVVLNEKVPHNHDRYRSDRLEPKYKTAEEHQAATN
jgi:hypothetical protein